MTYYAWTNFPVERNEWGQVTKTIECGEEVTAQKLGVSKEEFEDLVEIGAVSEEEYPDIPDSVAPAEYEKQQLNQAAVVQELEMASSGVTMEEQAEAASKAESVEEDDSAPKATPAKAAPVSSKE